MSNLLAKFTALGIIAAGFSLTGDLGWLARTGGDVLQVADVGTDQPAETAAAEASGGPGDSPEPPAPSPHAAGPRDAQGVFASEPGGGAARMPAAAGIPVAEMKCPTGGPRRVSWAAVRPGDRLVLWLGHGARRCLVLDVVDPASGEAVAYEAAAVSAEGRPLASVGPPRRVIVGRPSDGVPGTDLERGGLVHIAEAGIAGSDEGRWLGPIEAIATIR
jgi:hypothetical protein